MADVPVFVFENNDKKLFISKNKADIQATIDFLYERGMWSKFHKEQWSDQLSKINDAEKLHLWWDAITQGAMFEMESPLHERIESLGEMDKEKKECKTSKMKRQHKKMRNLDLED